ncbi:ATP-grasp domain-containing protein [Candidatus Pelagibacter sp.]|nr:ATP-grasp domain-containing protein [Candidatus Pelagibacter sp.]
MNILVTGAGGGVGQGVIKSLKLIKDMSLKIIAADMSELATGLYAADAAYLVENCNSDKYLGTLKKIFEKESIDFYIPGTDVELKFCSKNKKLIKDKFNVHTIISSTEVINICDDKFKTSFFLKKHGFNYPKTTYLKDLDLKLAEFPAIVKPAVGCNSKEVFKVNNLDELTPHLEHNKNSIIQEYIGNENTEYTCTIVKIDDELSPVLALKRTLRYGDTYKAEPVKSKKIEQYVSNVASKLEIDGGCNFQLRLDIHGKPKIFEINSRFSGTTPFCAQIGFNPVEFYLKRRAGLKSDVNIDYNSIILRYWSEVVVKKKFLKKLSKIQNIEPSVISQFKLFS